MTPTALRAKLIPLGVAVGATALMLAITQFVLPGGGEGGGTPGAILFNGFIFGLINSLLAIGVVLVYRSIRIINFAQAAIGAVGAVFTYNFVVLVEWPFWFALPAGLIVSVIFGLVSELIFIRRFFNAPRLVLTVITIALIGLASGAAGYMSNLPVFRNVEDRSQEEIAGAAEVQLPFESFKFQVGSLPLEFGFGHVLAIGTILLSILGLGLFLRFAKAGIAIRAVSENLERAPMLGINVGALSLIVWGITGFLSGLGAIMTGVVSQRFSASGGGGASLMLIALAAATIAQMRSLPIAVYAALLITMLRNAVSYSYENQLAALDAGLVVVLVLGLLLQRRRRERSEASEASAWKATEEYRPVPKEMLGVSGIRAARWVLAGLGLLFVGLYPWVVDTRQTNLGGYVAIIGIVMLSLVVLTGWAGQVSLGQFAFVAIGAVLGGAMTQRWNFPFWIAIIIVPVIVAAIAFLIGIPALRIRGLYLAVVTFALAFATYSGLFNEDYFGWLLPDRVDRPSLLGLINFEDERSMYYLCVVAFTLALLLVTTLRKSRAGRTMIAVRENEANSQSFGVNVVRMKLTAFALSGFLCGFAGVLLAHHQRAAQQASFLPTDSLDVFLFAVVGGVGSVSGILLGTIYFAVDQLLVGRAPWDFLVGDVGRIALLYAAPGGLAALVFGARDTVLRIIAQRRQMVVPSLFADVDPDAIARKLIPLGEPIPNQGLAALPFSQRYKKESGLYGEQRWLTPIGGKKRTTEEAAALGAAAEGLQVEGTQVLPAEG